jgi:hypothetical protein
MKLERAKSIHHRLGLTDFGSLLLTTGDLDPVYVMLYKAELSIGTLYRFLLAYWFFYHVGVAAKLSEIEGPKFFAAATELAQNGRGTPRGSERRHFRGLACMKSLDYFSKTYEDPNQAVAHLIAECKGKNVTDVLAFVKKWPLFGPWIGFKIGDMLERVGNVPITFRKEDLELYKSPTQGAIVWCQNECINYEEVGISGVVTLLENMFESYKAPPAHDRPVGVQECETILCKWHSHLNGHYPVGKDSREILEHLRGWGSLAESLQKYVPGIEDGAWNDHRLARAATQDH